MHVSFRFFFCFYLSFKERSKASAKNSNRGPLANASGGAAIAPPAVGTDDSTGMPSSAFPTVLSRVHATLWFTVSGGPSVGPSVCRSVCHTTFFFFLHFQHFKGPIDGTVTDRVACTRLMAIGLVCNTFTIAWSPCQMPPDSWFLTVRPLVRFKRET